MEYLDRVAEAVLAPAPDPAAGAGAPAPPGELAGAGRRLVVLGFSQGAETASRWATYGRVRPAELVLWGGGLAEDLEPLRAAAALTRLRPVFVVGDGDAWARQRSEQSLARLREWGVAAERVGYAGGHRVEADVLAERWPE